MIVIGVRFIAGRYHATIWGKHVNEGVPEWPPSPWRLLRGLVAVWKRNCTDIPEETMLSVLSKLARAPQFRLPPASVGHSRHFMPWFKKGFDDKTLVFDTFVVVPRREQVEITWPGSEPTKDEKVALRRLLSHLTYLGRSESWCECKLLEPPGEVPNCVPLKEASGGGDVVRVLVAEEGSGQYVYEALTVETGDLRSRARRIDPPGATWVEYSRPQDALVSSRPSTDRPWKPATDIVGVRFSLHRKPLPQVQQTLRLGEHTRRAVMGCYRAMFGPEIPSVLTGRRGSTLLSGHRHAYYLPTDEDGDGRVDHLTVYAADGFDEKSLQALCSLRFIRWDEGEAYQFSATEQRGSSVRERSIIRVLFLGVVRSTDIRTLGNSSVFGPAQRWRSRTPMVLARHPKVRNNGEPKLDDRGLQVDGPQHQIDRELQQRARGDRTDMPAIATMTKTQYLELAAGSNVRWLSFRTQRKSGSGRSTGLTYGFEIEFDKPVLGPLAFGYGAHFGLGQFMPVD